MLGAAAWRSQLACAQTYTVLSARAEALNELLENLVDSDSNMRDMTITAKGEHGRKHDGATPVQWQAAQECAKLLQHIQVICMQAGPCMCGSRI